MHKKRFLSLRKDIFSRIDKSCRKNARKGISCRKNARNHKLLKSCSKGQKLPKSCRATCVKAYYQLPTVNLVQPNVTLPLPPFLITIQHTIHWLVCRKSFSRSMVSLLLPLLDLFLWLGSLRETNKSTCSQASLCKPLVSQQNDPCTYRSTVFLLAIRGDLSA